MPSIIDLTFGFMDPGRGNAANGSLFRRLRDQAVESFSQRRVCNLAGLKPEAVTDCHKYLFDGPGRIAGEIRDSLFRATSGTIRVSDVESYFLYSFTVGINGLAPMLSEPKSLKENSSTPLPGDILTRRFRVHGPGWLATAVDREIPSLVGVFSDFQNNIIGPIAKTATDAPRLLSDAIAGSFLCAFVGGVQWLRELALDTTRDLCKTNAPANGHGRHVCQLKKSTQLIPYADLGRLCLLATSVSEEFQTLG